MSFAYPVYRLDWALSSVAIFFHYYFPLLERFENVTFILPHHFPAALINFAGRGGDTPPKSWQNIGFSLK